MPIRTSEATWQGGFPKGEGTMALGSGAFEGQYSFNTRMENAPGTNPEELLGAAHAGCFSMALAAALTKAGHAPQRIHTSARVHLEKVGEGFSITRIELDTEGQVPNIDEQTFRDFAEKAKTGCVISKALGDTPMDLNVRFSAAERVGSSR